MPSRRTVAIRLEPAERRDGALARHLNARKLVRWSDKKVEPTLATIDVPCVLMVANTVRTALEWFRKAARATAARRRGVALERELFLVTGRMRPLDRQKTLDAVESRLEGREPTLVVATQCIEAGVDWDFDAMISECASWDALVQRMGRVNRRGERHDAECFILQAQRTFKGPDAGEKSCPVYGEHEIRTASWIADVSPVRCTPGVHAGSSGGLRAPADFRPGADSGMPRSLVPEPGRWPRFRCIRLPQAARTRGKLRPPGSRHDRATPRRVAECGCVALAWCPSRECGAVRAVDRRSKRRPARPCTTSPSGTGSIRSDRAPQ